MPGEKKKKSFELREKSIVEPPAVKDSRDRCGERNASESADRRMEGKRGRTILQKNLLSICLFRARRCSLHL